MGIREFVVKRKIKRKFLMSMTDTNVIFKKVFDVVVGMKYRRTLFCNYY
jgi:hypothetical protein